MDYFFILYILKYDNEVYLILNLIKNIYKIKIKIMEIWQILTIVFGILAGFFGFYWNRAKTIISELGILFNVISESLDDDKLTKEELQVIVNQIKKIFEAFKKDGSVKTEVIEEAKQKVVNLKMK